MSNFLIQYAVSATPIEELVAADASQSSRLVHTNIDKSVGGSKEIAFGTSAANVGYKNATLVTNTNSTLDSITSLDVNLIDFLFVSIKALSGDNTDADCLVKFGSQTVCWLKRVGESMVVRPNGQNGSAIGIYSTATAKICEIDIMWGLE